MTLVEFDTRLVLIVNVALFEPAATVTVDGTDATDELLLERLTEVFTDATAVSVTVPCELFPPDTLVGLSVSDERVAAVPLTQTLLVHVWPFAQPPQVRAPPQPSEMLPQFFPCAAQVVGVQAVQTLLTQVAGAVQVPQLSVPPQPSEMLPQFFPWAAQVVGVQEEARTVSVSLTDRGPSVAAMVTVVVVATGCVEMVTFSTLLPAGMVTLGGTLAT